MAPLIDPTARNFSAWKPGAQRPSRWSREVAWQEPWRPAPRPAKYRLVFSAGHRGTMGHSDGFALQLRPLVESFKAGRAYVAVHGRPPLQTAYKASARRPLSRRRRSAACHEDQVSLAIFEKRSRLQSTGAFSAPTEGDKGPPSRIAGLSWRLARRSGLCRPIPLITLRERPN